MKLKLEQAKLYLLERKYAHALEIYRDISINSPGVKTVDGLIKYCEHKVNNVDASLLDIKINPEKIESAPSGIFSKLENSITKVSSMDHLQNSWVAVITLWKRKEYLLEQIAAINNQSIKPVEIIIVLNENHISEKDLPVEQENIRVIKSTINSLYTRWFVGYLSNAKYISVFDDDIIPGRLWIQNAIRACEQNNALVGSAGRIYNKDGIKSFFELVVPNQSSKINEVVNCNDRDVYCDWICNSYFFKKEWIAGIVEWDRYQHTHKTFDDIQLSVSLQVNLGLKCVVPAQPKDDMDYWGSTRHEYGNDEFAIWKTNQEKHFTDRKLYIEELIDSVYRPVRDRNDLYRIILIVPFADFELLIKCIRTVKSQDYKNIFTVIVDDSQQMVDRSEEIKAIGLNSFKYIKTNEKMGPLGSRILATQEAHAKLNDIIFHLDGDDWLSGPDALSIIAKEYTRKNIEVTYGNTLSFFPREDMAFWAYYKFEASTEWGFSKKERTEHVSSPMRMYTLEEIDGDWRNAPWSGMHARTYLYSNYLKSSKNHYFLNGEFLKISTDAAIFLSILNSTNYANVSFVKDYIYVYRNGSNTIHSKNELKDSYKKKVRKAIKEAEMVRPKYSDLNKYLEGGSLQVEVKKNKYKVMKDTVDYHLYDKIGNGKRQSPSNSGVVTVITKNYLADALMCLLSASSNVVGGVHKYVYISDINDEEYKIISNLLRPIGVIVLYLDNLFLQDKSDKLRLKYGPNTDEFRWAMKSLMLMELIQRGCSSAVFMDPDLYSTADLTEIFKIIQNNDACVFPHFRNPDDEYLRSVLYRDGFYNGGLISINMSGYHIAEKLYERCFNQMIKDASKNRWDDQKYFDLIPLENSNVYINQDRGIDYNPWNYEPAEGFVSTNIDSFLINSGFFVRNWHMSTNMIKQSVDRHPRHIRYLVVTYFYLMALAVQLIILVSGLSKSHTKMYFGLLERYKSITNTLEKIVTRKDELHKFNSLIQEFKIDGVESCSSLSVSKLIDIVNCGLYDVMRDSFVLQIQNFNEDVDVLSIMNKFNKFDFEQSKLDHLRKMGITH